MKDMIFEELRQRLERKDNYSYQPDERSVMASVMMVMRDTSVGVDMLFIKRPDHPNDTFSGHIAFPGGKMSNEDSDLLETAIRETREEVGIDIRESGRIIGKLDDTKPSNRRADFIIVTPYVSMLTQEVEIVPNEEVDEYMWIPVEHLLDENNMRIRTKIRDDRYIEDYVFSYDKYIIWGMTGRVLRKFIVEFGDLLNCR